MSGDIKPVSTCSAAEMQAVLEKLPQKAPFLFIDRILELSDQHIVAERLFTGEEDFYRGHFPGDAVTPGVILVETMAQAGLVALGLYLMGKERPNMSLRTLFTDCQVEFLDIVRPGTKVIVSAQRVFWRRNKLKSNVELRTDKGVLVASGNVSGMGVVV